MLLFHVHMGVVVAVSKHIAVNIGCACWCVRGVLPLDALAGVYGGGVGDDYMDERAPLLASVATRLPLQSRMSRIIT